MILQRHLHIYFVAYIVALNLCIDVVWSCDCNVAKLKELGIEDGHIPDAAITASSTLDPNHGPGRGRLNQGPTGSQGTAWCAEESNSDQYLQIDLIYTSRVTHIATQGMNDPPENVNGSAVTSWVKGYTLEYSSDGEAYNGYYVDKDLKVFDGNNNGNSVSCCELPYPLVVQYLRFKPVSWQTKICLRVGVFGVGNVTANNIVTDNQIAVRHYWWWPLMWILIILLVLIMLLVLCCHRRIRNRLGLRPRPGKTEKKQPSFYTNPRTPNSQPQQNGTMTIVMTDITESHENENYEEPEDEVQEVLAHFTDDGFDNKQGVTHFSVADEDEDESPAVLPDQNRNGTAIRGASISSDNHPYRGASVSSQDRRNTGRSEHLYESVAER